MSSLHDSLAYHPAELKFGTSGLRDLAVNMTDLECYINVRGFLEFLRRSEPENAHRPVLLAGDLRDSTPRILRAVHQAIQDDGRQTKYYGLIPTPALASCALSQGAPCVMVTGSHIPAERNGIKFYKTAGEVLKADEAGIHAGVADVRAEVYSGDFEAGSFTAQGSLKLQPSLPKEDGAAAAAYLRRYQSIFPSDLLAGKKLVFYQHSAVGRDLLVELLRSLGADVATAGRSDIFVPIDSENVTPDDQAYFRELAAEHPDAFAILSTDGDSDRPFLIDASGSFHRGDVLGAVAARWLAADFAAFPVSASDALDSVLGDAHIAYQRTKIGSPYVISAMNEALAAGRTRAVGWEVNGGFLTASDLTLHSHSLPALPTRDAIFPILCALSAALGSRQTVAELFAALPRRFTGAGLIDDFPVEVSRAIMERFANDTPAARTELAGYFSAAAGFGPIQYIDTLDGLRLLFQNGDVAHLRPSGNAPQLRIYSTADTQKRADDIVRLAITGPHSIFRALEQDVK